MDNLFNKAARQSTLIRSDLDALRVAETGTSNLAALQGQLSVSFATLQNTLKDLDELVKREIVMERREQSKQYFLSSLSRRDYGKCPIFRRLKELNIGYRKMREEFDGIRATIREAEASKNRAELFQRPSASSPSTAPAIEVTPLDHARADHDSLQYTGTRLDEYIAIGMHTLDGLRNQRATLKGTHRKVLDATATLGLSRTVMRVIERRTKRDQYIFWTGVLLTLVVLYYCIRR